MECFQYHFDDRANVTMIDSRSDSHVHKIHIFIHFANAISSYMLILCQFSESLAHLHKMYLVKPSFYDIWINHLYSLQSGYLEASEPK